MAQSSSARAQARIVVEAIDPDGEAHGVLDLDAVITGPDKDRAVRLHEAHVGTYEASFMADRSGRYQVRIDPPGEEGETVYESPEAQLHVTYPARYEFSRPGSDRLTALASVTGGRMLLGDERIFVDGAAWRWTTWQAWPLWALIAVALFLADLLLRYTPNLLRFGRRQVPAAPTRQQEGARRAVWR